MRLFRIILPLLTLLLAFGCDKKPAKVAVDSDVYYTCSMHPQVMEQKPGKCPICGMPLIPVRKNTTTTEGELQLNDLQIQLGNIHVDSARVRIIQEELLLPGRIVVDQEQVATISPHVMGRVEKLHFKNIGERVQQGQPLYALYSEDLNVAVSELLVARDVMKSNDPSVSDHGRLVRIARNKLLGYGLSEAQVNELATASQAPYTIEFLSPASGVITELSVREGESLMQGDGIMKVAALSSLWAEAQAYPADRAHIKMGTECSVTIPALPDTVITARLAFSNPELDPGSIVGLVRLNISNQGGLLQPGMQAYVHVPMSEVRTLALPTDAVLRDGKGATVWIATQPGHFKVVMVTVGIEAGGFTQITSGIKVGDQVVISGAFLLNSEYRFRQGIDPMQGMKM